MRCMVEGEDFDGRIKQKGKAGRNIITSLGSVEESLIANWMEAHCGFRFTMEQVNKHHRQQGLEGVRRYCVMSVFYRLKPKIDILQKIVSGGHNQAWITARHNVTKQMQVVLGRLIREDFLRDPETGRV